MDAEVGEELGIEAFDALAGETEPGFGEIDFAAAVIAVAGFGPFGEEGYFSGDGIIEGAGIDLGEEPCAGALFVFEEEAVAEDAGVFGEIFVGEELKFGEVTPVEVGGAEAVADGIEEGFYIGDAAGFLRLGLDSEGEEGVEFVWGFGEGEDGTAGFYEEIEGGFGGGGVVIGYLAEEDDAGGREIFERAVEIDIELEFLRERSAPWAAEVDGGSVGGSGGVIEEVACEESGGGVFADAGGEIELGEENAAGAAGPFEEGRVAHVEFAIDDGGEVSVVGDFDDDGGDDAVVAPVHAAGAGDVEVKGELVREEGGAAAPVGEDGSFEATEEGVIGLAGVESAGEGFFRAEAEAEEGGALLFEDDDFEAAGEVVGGEGQGFGGGEGVAADDEGIGGVEGLAGFPGCGGCELGDPSGFVGGVPQKEGRFFDSFRRGEDLEFERIGAEVLAILGDFEADFSGRA